MYRILQALNNNVALVKDEQGKQAVVMGLGITFQKKKGDLIVASKIEKIFSLKTEESKENLLTLLKDVPFDFISVTYDVIDSLSNKYDYPIQEYLYVTLTDHIYAAYKAVLNDSYKDSRLPDISNEYVTEYQMAAEALAIFRKQLLEQLPDDELGRIALHFINAKSEGEKVARGKDVTREILTKIQAELQRSSIERTEDNRNFYDRLMVHLTYFIEYLDRDHADNQALLEMEEHIKTTYPKAYLIGSKLYDIIAEETGINLYESERFYIALHIQRLL